MARVEMRELVRSVRGQAPNGETPPGHIMGMVSSVRSAIHRVHSTSPEAGKIQIRKKLDKWLVGASSTNPGTRATATAAGNYIATVEQYADWQDQSKLKFLGWEEKGIVRYSDDDLVEVLVRVVMEDSAGKIWGRVVLWDRGKLSLQAASLMASPAVEILDDRYGVEDVGGIETWQCRTGESYAINAANARALRTAVATHVAGM